MANSTGKIAEVMFESTLETIEDQHMLADTCTMFQPDAGKLQDAGDVIWRPVEQQAVIQDGDDLTGQETGIIEETYPSILGVTKSDFVKQSMRDSRDMGFWERRGQRSGRQMVTTLNTAIADAIKTQGSGFYRSDAASGFTFISEAQAMLNEEQRSTGKRNFILNDRSSQKFAQDLAGRQTLQGRPEEVWNKGQIAQNVAEFDVYTGSFLSNLTGGALAGVTVDGAQSFAPEAGSVDLTTGQVTNVDYRVANVSVSSSAGLNVGDKITFAGVNAIGNSDKNDANRLKTFTVVGKPDATTISIYPKPIAFDDAALSTIEKAYANVNTTLADAAAVTRLNSDASAKSNIFYDSDAVEVVTSAMPADLFSQFAGFKVIQSTTKGGLPLYMVYDGRIDDLSFRYRIFSAWGVTIADPQRCGVAIDYSA